MKSTKNKPTKRRDYGVIEDLQGCRDLLELFGLASVGGDNEQV